MPNFDHGMLKRKNLWIPYSSSNAMLGASGVDVSTGVGDMVQAEISTLSMTALVITAGDEHDVFLPLMRDMNITRELGVRHMFSSASTTSADTYTWITLYDIIAEDAAIAIGTTAMSTTHVAASDTDSGVANSWQWSTRASLNGNTFTETNLTNSELLAINVELDATDASETIHYIGTMLDYVPKRFLGNPNATRFNAAYDQEK